MTKYFIHTRGGLGDHFIGYFYPKNNPFGFGYLQQLKEEEPSSIVRLAAHVAFNAPIEFFKYHPFINEIEKQEWRGTLMGCSLDEVKGYISLEEFGRKNGWVKRPNSKIYTSEEDDHYIKSVLGNEPFVAIHPFASEKPRRPLTLQIWYSIIDNIIDNLKLNVVVLGDSYVRVRTHNRKLNVKEDFDYERSGLINLVNKSNIRVGIAIAHKAKVLIGGNSCFWCSAKGGNVPFIGLRPTSIISEDFIARKFAKPELVDMIDITQKKSRVHYLIIEHIKKRI